MVQTICFIWCWPTYQSSKNLFFFFFWRSLPVFAGMVVGTRDWDSGPTTEMKAQHVTWRASRGKCIYAHQCLGTGSVGLSSPAIPTKTPSVVQTRIRTRDSLSTELAAAGSCRGGGTSTKPLHPPIIQESWHQLAYQLCKTLSVGWPINYVSIG